METLLWGRLTPRLNFSWGAALYRSVMREAPDPRIGSRIVTQENRPRAEQSCVSGARQGTDFTLRGGQALDRDSWKCLAFHFLYLPPPVLF